MRTLIIACSATKRPDAGLMPALERYDGPAYRTLRANLEAAGPLRIFILSAELGLIHAATPIADYDRRMTAARAAVLAPVVGDELITRDRKGELAGDIFVCAGSAYRDCIRSSLADVPLLGRLRFSAGGIGEQLGQLKAFLLACAPSQLDAAELEAGMREAFGGPLASPARVEAVRDELKATGAYIGARVRRARKAGPCANGGLPYEAGNAPNCRRTIAVGDPYADGELDPYKAGGFGSERICAGCAGIPSEGSAR